MRIKNPLLLLILLILSTSSLAQKYNFISYTLEDGLAQSQVRAIYQDNEGYMWFGTLGGISKFDGVHFINFSTSDGILDNRINVIRSDNSGTIWFGHSKGLTSFDGQHFIVYPMDSLLSKFQIRCLAIDEKNRVWFGTDGAGFGFLENGKFRTFTTENGLSDDNVKSLCFDNEAQLWIGTRSGINCMKDMAFNINELTEQLSEISVSDILVNEETLTFCSLGNGLFQYSNNNLSHFTTQNGLISNNISSGIDDGAGNIWLSSNDGISKFDGNVFRNFTKDNGLPDFGISSIHADIEENVWMGTNGGGVVKFAGETFMHYTEEDGLSSDLVLSIAEDAKEQLWFSTYGKGITKFGKESCSYYNMSNSNLRNDIVWSSCIDLNDNPWFGTADGLCQFKDEMFYNLSVQDGLLDRRILSLLCNKNGHIWAGSRHGVSIITADTIRTFSYKNQDIGKNIRCIIQTSKEDIWLASENGAYLYKNESFQHFDRTDGLTDNTIVSITEDKNGWIWFGSAQGLSYYDGNHFTPIKFSKNHSSNYIGFLVIDDYNNLWIGTDNGLWQLNVDLLKSKNEVSIMKYTPQEGLTSLECNQNAAYKDGNGNLWLGMISGVVKYQPREKSRTKPSTAPITNITDILLFREQSNWLEKKQKIDRKTGLPINLILSHRENHLTFNFIGIYHSNPHKVNYRFRLKGFEEMWAPATKAQFATYSNLPFGDYQFEVFAEIDGLASEKSTFLFTITPPYWRTNWFYTLAFITSIALVVSLIYWRKKIHERERITDQLKMRSKLLSLEQKSLNASMNRHFIFNALNSIQYYINVQDKLAANRYLTSFAKLIRKNLDDTNKNLIPIGEELERMNLYLTLEHMRFKDRFEYEIIVDSDVDQVGLRIPSMILQPYVENSIWHGILPQEEGGKVSIHIKNHEDNRIAIIIQDDGIGIETSLNNKGDREQDHISKGISIIKSRVSLIREMTQQDVYVQGPVSIKLENGQIGGTQVLIVLPIDYEGINNNLSQ